MVRYAGANSTLRVKDWVQSLIEITLEVVMEQVEDATLREVEVAV